MANRLPSTARPQQPATAAGASPSAAPMPRCATAGLLLAAALVLGPAPARAQSQALAPESVHVQVHDELVELNLSLHTRATRARAWQVLTDFDHMAEVLPGLSLSEVVEREGSVLQVHQKGRASFGLISKSFDNRKQITLEPERRILSHGESAELRASDSVTELVEQTEGLEIRYRLRLVPANPALAGLIGRALRQQTAENFSRLLAAMERGPGSP